MRIALMAERLYSWGGGRDLLLDFGKALEYAKSIKKEKIELFLLVPNKKKFESGIIDVVLGKKGIDEYLEDYALTKKQLDLICDNFKKYCCSFRIVFYDTINVRYVKYVFLNRIIKKLRIDVCFPTVFSEKEKIGIPTMTYIPDFQHKYLPNFFSEEEIELRNISYETIAMKAEHVLVTSQDTKRDIEKFFPLHKCNIYCMPFAPICADAWTKSMIADISRYCLPKKFFMISNQFWQHKSHITAFKALEILYDNGYKDIHIVCTGKMEDDRNDTYVSDLLNEVAKLKCRDNIHFLGYIPKDDQIQMLKNAIGLIQMTLYEGNPGGNSTLDAISVGVPCILSDIAVNLEIDYYPRNRVAYFKQSNEEDLAEKMLFIKEEGWHIVDENELFAQMVKGKELLADSILRYIKFMISNN